ncbi:phage portal protein [Sphingomonas sanguinis]|uniref:phage portal protein n=1 Tax=Sphingomonas sanguinis TaxID=33051 RepID=UPI000AD25373|nr:phage portal protein [Sphingomonas sanguinis]
MARSFNASPHHSSAILLKRNIVVSELAATPYLSSAVVERIVQDFLVFGECYLLKIANRFGGLVRLDYLPAKYMRRGVKPGVFWYVPGGSPEVEYPAGAVIQIMQPDINQEIYGSPEYISAIQAALLNEAATLFRRRYYLNGSHAGYILYATGDIDERDTKKLRAALHASKGPGNFRNLFVHAPAGKEGSLKIIPVAEQGAKDVFMDIKNATRDDVLAAHRVPPQLLGIVPAQGSSFGSPKDATGMFWMLEIIPLLSKFLRINDEVLLNVVVTRRSIESVEIL